MTTTSKDDPLDLTDAEYQELLDGVAELKDLTASVVEAGRTKSKQYEASVQRLRAHLAKLNKLTDDLEARPRTRARGSAWPGAIILLFVLLVLAFIVAPRTSKGLGSTATEATPISN